MYRPLFNCIFLESGTIHHENYDINEDLSWTINSDCEKVRIESVTFLTEFRYDFVTIEGEVYSGNAIIDQDVPPDFTVSFNSDNSVTDDGFILNWACSDL